MVRAGFFVPQSVPPLIALAITLLTACGEPLYTPIASIELVEAGAVQRASDARASDAGGSDGGSFDCVILPEQSAGMSTGNIAVTSASALDCTVPDAGSGLLPDNIFTRNDHQLMVRRGELYSFRWPVPPVLTRARVYGGDDPCPTTPLVDVGTSLLTPSGALTSCQEFVSPVDAHQVMLFGIDYLLALQTLGSSSGPLDLMLCHSPCPVNSQSTPPPPADAGNPVLDLGDGGPFQLPGFDGGEYQLPTIPNPTIP